MEDEADAPVDREAVGDDVPEGTGGCVSCHDKPNVGADTVPE